MIKKTREVKVQMPLQIIRQDITKISCDAIINPTNVNLEPTGGADAAIHKAAGHKLSAETAQISHLTLGDAVLTKGYNLPAKYIIHTPAPLFESDHSLSLLTLCYHNSLRLASEQGFESIAFPLIGAGSQGFPNALVLRTALGVISKFLLSHEMLVTLCVYDKESFSLSEKLFDGIEQYIDDSYVVENTRRMGLFRRKGPQGGFPYAPMPMRKGPSVLRDNVDDCTPLSDTCEADAFSDIDKYLKLDESFSLKLLKLIDAKGISEVQCYKKANVSKQTWYKIMNDKSYKPNKKTAISFAVSLRLTLGETQTLLASVGFVLSESSLFDVIIMYCLEKGIYDIFQIDSVLFKYDQETLFSKF